MDQLIAVVLGAGIVASALVFVAFAMAVAAFVGSRVFEWLDRRS